MTQVPVHQVNGYVQSLIPKLVLLMPPEDLVNYLSSQVFSEASSLVLHVVMVRQSQELVHLHMPFDLFAVLRDMVDVRQSRLINLLDVVVEEPIIPLTPQVHLLVKTYFR